MNSFISRIGGKCILRKRIISEFPPKFDRYIEVFGGAAWVLFGIQKPAKLEIYNDLDEDLTNLFKIVKYHLPELKREFKWSLQSRQIFFESLSQLRADGLTDIQRASRYLIKCRMSFGANGSEFSCKSRNFDTVFKNMEKAMVRLKKQLLKTKRGKI